MQQDFCVPKMLQLFTVVKEMFICKNTSLLKCVQLFTNQQREDILQHDIIIIFKTYRCQKSLPLKVPLLINMVHVSTCLQFNIFYLTIACLATVDFPTKH